MTRRVLTDEQETQVTRDYLAGATGDELHLRYGVSAPTIAKAVRRNGYTMRKRGSFWVGSDEQIAAVLAAYAAGGNVQAIARSYRTHETVIRKVMIDNDIAIRTSKKRRAIHPDQEPGIADRYLAGESSSSLAKDFHCCVPTIMNALDRQGVTRRVGGMSHFWTSERIQEASRLTLDGATTNDIANLWGVSPSNVGIMLRRAGVIKPPPRRTRDKHPSWKGGRSINSSGYVLVTNGDGTGYTLEHRKVMAEHIGRPLKRSESVHHIDGDRQNNDINNLQLRFGKHGNGIVLRCGDCESRNIISTPL